MSSQVSVAVTCQHGSQHDLDACAHAVTTTCMGAGTGGLLEDCGECDHPTLSSARDPAGVDVGIPAPLSLRAWERSWARLICYRKDSLAALKPKWIPAHIEVNLRKDQSVAQVGICLLWHFSILKS